MNLLYKNTLILNMRNFILLAVFGVLSCDELVLADIHGMLDENRVVFHVLKENISKTGQWDAKSPVVLSPQSAIATCSAFVEKQAKSKYELESITLNKYWDWWIYVVRFHKVAAGKVSGPPEYLDIPIYLDGKLAEYENDKLHW